MAAVASLKQQGSSKDWLKFRASPLLRFAGAKMKRESVSTIACTEMSSARATCPHHYSTCCPFPFPFFSLVDVRLNLSARSYATYNRTIQRCNLRVSSDQVISYSCNPSVDGPDDSIKASFSSSPNSAVHRTVVLREANGKDGKGKKRSVELWRGERRLVSVDVTAHHGSFNTSDTFGSFSVHDDMILYTAEANTPKRETSIIIGKEEDGLQDWEYAPSLGEKFNGQAQPTVFLLRLNLEENESGESARLCHLRVAKQDSDKMLASALFGQAVFSSTGKNVFLTGYPTIQDGRRLGIIYCSNRPAIVYMISIDELSGGRVSEKDSVSDNPWIPHTWKRLSPMGMSARSPRSNVDPETCFWLQSEEGGAHRDCDSLASFDGKGEKEEIPIQIVPQTGTGWPGLFVDQLRRSCLLEKVEGMATDTIWGSRKTIVVYSFGSKDSPVEVTPLGNKIALQQSKEEMNAMWSYTLLCTDGLETLVAVRSSPLHPQQILVGRIGSEGSRVNWIIARRLVKEWEDEKEIKSLMALQSSIEEVTATKSSKEGDMAAQAVLLQKTDSTRVSPAPCILFPHGGPHSTFTTDWSPSNAALCLLGYTLIMPNYHGSLGRGQQFAQSLVGQCSRLDVEDCISSVQQFITTGLVDKENLYVQGGSHGGFLTVHLIGMYPRLFRRAIVRNPVTAAGIMEGTTDIPDWCYSEFGIPFDYHDSPPMCPTTEQYKQLQESSPIHQIDAIQSPLLILAGLNDKRVPPAQSKLLYHRLKGKDKTTRMLAFEGQDHALDGVECELVAWLATLRWLKGQED